MKRLLNALICVWIIILPISIIEFKELEQVRKIILLGIFMIGFSGIKFIETSQLKQALISFCSVLVFAFYGIINGNDMWAIQEGLAILGTIIPVFYIIILYHNSMLDVRKIRKAIIFSMYLFFILNGVLLLCLLPIDFFMEYKALIIERFIENNPSFDLQLTGFMGVLPRLDNGANLFPYLMLFFVINENKDNLFLWIVSLLACVIGNSRLVILCYVVLIIYCIKLRIEENIRRNSCLKMLAKMAIYVFVFTYLLTAFFDVQGIEVNANIGNEYISDRYDGDSATESNSVRELQLTMLMDSIQDNVLMGSGLGGYITKGMTDPEHPWNIEIMPIALLMQIGIVGYVFIMINFFAFFIRSIYRTVDKSKITPLSLAFLFWLFGASVQGNLFIGNFPGCILICIFIMSCNYEEMVTTKHHMRSVFQRCCTWFDNLSDKYI